MTDRTHPDSGFPIAYSHYATYAEYVEALHARIAELEAQLESIRAGGVSGPLVGQPQAMPDLSALTERGAQAWTGVDAQGLREGFTAADMATASAQGFRDGVASVAASAGTTEYRGWGYAKLPEPVAYSLGLAKYAHSSNIIAANEFTPDTEHADEWESLVTMDQARDFADRTHEFRERRGDESLAANAGSEPVAQLAAERDELFQAAIDFIRTLTGMEPPPIEVAPPEVFAPFHAFVNTIQAITNKRNSPPREGMVMVPKEPTHHMLNAAASAYKDARQSLGAYNAPWAAYRAMLEVAAPPTTSAGSGKGE